MIFRNRRRCDNAGPDPRSGPNLLSDHLSAMAFREKCAFSELMEIRDGSSIDKDEVKIVGEDNMFRTPFKIGQTCAEVLAARAVAANDLWELRKGRRQKISINTRAAAATALAGTGMTCKRGENGDYEPTPPSPQFDHMTAVTQPWPTADGCWVLPHTNMPHLERRVLGLLVCENTPESLAAAVAQWNSDELEEAIANVNACSAKVHTPEEWLKHPQRKYLQSQPVVEITKVSDTDPIPLPEGDEPLSGIRVLDLTRILAGPTAGLGLAEHGADVLMVTAPHLPQMTPFVRDTSHGKRSCFLDFNVPNEADQLRGLVEQADVFIDGYRPNRIASHGFGTEDLVKMRPGIVHVSVNCYGSGGPFHDRAGWDQIAQVATGMSQTQGKSTGANKPELITVYVCDFLTGFLASYGAMVALARRAKYGGSYTVKVSLCQSAMLLQRQGLKKNFEMADEHLSPSEFDEHAHYDDNTYLGDLKSLGPIIRMSETSPKWRGTTPKLGSSKPEWLPR